MTGRLILLLLGAYIQFSLLENIKFILSEDILICSNGRGKKRKYRIAETYYFLFIYFLSSLVVESPFFPSPGERISGV
jgi:hypothetical protein